MTRDWVTDLREIAAARVLFGYQSVGRDVLARAAAFAREAGVPLQTLEFIHQISQGVPSLPDWRRHASVGWATARSASVISHSPTCFYIHRAADAAPRLVSLADYLDRPKCIMGSEQASISS